MARRRKSYYTPGPVVWRVLFGRNGPTKAAMGKAWREWTGPKTVASARIDEETGKLKTKGLKRKADGTFVYAPPKTGRAGTAKQRTAEARKRNAAAVAAHRRQPGPAPMSERAIREPDGTLNGSRKAGPPQ